MSDTLLTTLATAMAQLVTAIDLTDEDDVDPDLATTWFEDVADHLGRLSAEDRHRLAALFREAAMDETRPEFREAMLEVPENFGLEDDDEYEGEYDDAA
ncbi:hypothetical protein J7E96_09825 [Streptomyces sp. ISL-96]|uniref:hypothetical protein n=1 Tax=Streptomyces sp. ISL-96 TaxID=2819191 RepID=UPI001BEBC3FA|nr:hypothetical protein [Streptomyces sp. ISL-96]MBT2488815.1 hypothetical protein [Streptomyces sp. ISL-96]